MLQNRKTYPDSSEWEQQEPGEWGQHILLNSDPEDTPNEHDNKNILPTIFHKKQPSSKYNHNSTPNLEINNTAHYLCLTLCSCQTYVINKIVGLFNYCYPTETTSPIETTQPTKSHL
jgi:hypothetical protein